MSDEVSASTSFSGSVVDLGDDDLRDALIREGFDRAFDAYLQAPELGPHVFARRLVLFANEVVGVRDE